MLVKAVNIPRKSLDETTMELGRQSSSPEIQVHENRLSKFTNPIAKRLNNRQKAKNAKLKSKSFKIKHSLVRLMEFPMDVFLEVATNLEPIDILHFSRVSKHFRSLLNPKNSRYVWIAARRNIEGLPDCPPDLTEAQYASLMFENICRACGVRTVKVDYCLRVRFCSPCFQMNVSKGGTIAKTYQLGNLPSTVYKLLPRTMPAFVPQGLLLSSTSNTFHDMYYVPELRLVVKRFKSLEHDKVALGHFIQEQQTLATQVAKRCLTGTQPVNKTRQNERGSLATSRRKSITTKLIELGWDQSSFPKYWESDEWRKIMDQPRELTPRIWAQVSPRLIRILEALREERLEATRQHRLDLRAKEFSILWDEHLLSYPPEDRYLLPNRHDAVLLTSVATALEEDSGNVNVTSERFNLMLPGALVDSSQFKIKVQSDLLEVLEGPSRIPETSVAASGKDSSTRFDRLYQVSAIFCCRRCIPLGGSHRLLTFPIVLSHSHMPERRWQNSFRAAGREIEDLVTELLRIFGLPSGTLRNSKAFRQIEGRFLCNCGSLPVEDPLDFMSLLEHIRRSNEWHTTVLGMAMSRRGFTGDRKNRRQFSVTDDLHDDHAIECLASLLSLAQPNAIDTSLRISQKSPSDYVGCCEVCAELAGYNIMLTQGQITYHMNAKHHINDNVMDMINQSN